MKPEEDQYIEVTVYVGHGVWSGRDFVVKTSADDGQWTVLPSPSPLSTDSSFVFYFNVSMVVISELEQMEQKSRARLLSCRGSIRYAISH